MKRTLIAALLLVASALPASAATRNCTSQLVTGGLCRDATNQLLYYDVPTDVGLRIADAFATQYGYPETVICDAGRVAAGQCAENQRGDQIPNPMSKAAFADQRIRQFIIDTVSAAEAAAATRAAQDAANAEPDADVGGE